MSQVYAAKHFTYSVSATQTRELFSSLVECTQLQISGDPKPQTTLVTSAVYLIYLNTN